MRKQTVGGGGGRDLSEIYLFVHSETKQIKSIHILYIYWQLCHYGSPFAFVLPFDLALLLSQKLGWSSHFNDRNSGGGGGGGGALMYNVRRVCAAYKTPVFTPDLPLSRHPIFNNLPLRRPPEWRNTPFKIRSIAYLISWCVRTACRGRRSLVLGALARALV